MTLAVLFWVLMIIWLIFGFWNNWPAQGTAPWRPIGGHLLTWVLLAILGWQVFGPAIHR